MTVQNISVMRIREKVPLATCVKMTDEMNGDTTRKLASNKESELKPRSDKSLSQEDNDSSNPSRQSNNSGVKSRVRKTADDETHSPGSPNSEDLISSSGGRLKFFKDGKFILELSHRKEGEKTCWLPVTKQTYWPAIGTPRNEGSTTLSVSDDSSSVQSSPWQRDHCWKQNHPKPNLSKEQQFHFTFCGSRPEVLVPIMKIKARRPFDLDFPSLPLNHKLKEKRKIKKSKKGLGSVLKIIWEKALKSCKLEQGIVSPRKRILRELERVTLEEASKRQRAKGTVSSHSISSILAKDDDSVLRNLLRSPSPEKIRINTGIPNAHFPPQHIPVVHPPTGSLFFPQLSQSFRAQIHPNHIMWPFPPSSPAQLSHYPSRYAPSWPHSHRAPTQDTNTDVPLNLSKNAG